MKRNKRSLISNTVSLYLMNFVKLVFPIITLPYLTRVLTIELYGTVTFIKSVLAYVVLIIDFGFMLSATKKIVLADGDLKMISQITSYTLMARICLGFLSAIGYILLIFFLPIMRVNLSFTILYLIAFLLNIFIFDFLFRGIEKMYLVAVPYVVAKTISTIFTLMLVKSDNELLLIPAFEFLGNIIAVIISLYFVLRLEIKFSFNSFKNIWNEIKESSVYFVSNFATTMLGAMTIIIVGIKLPTDKVAIWGICMQLLSAAKSLYNPISNSLYPYMIKSKSISLINKISLYFTIPMVLGCTTVAMYGKQIIMIIAGPSYQNGGEVLITLLPAFVFSFFSMIYGWPVLGAINKEKETTRTTVLAGLFQMLIIFILILTNKFSLVSVAFSCSLSEFLLFILRVVVIRKNINHFH